MKKTSEETKERKRKRADRELPVLLAPTIDIDTSASKKTKTMKPVSISVPDHLSRPFTDIEAPQEAVCD